MSRFVFAIDTLPSDVVEILLNCLTGWDLVRLSHVNQRFFQELLAPDALVWHQRIPSIASPNIMPAKERYVRSTSIQFTGQDGTKRTQSDRGGALPLWRSSYWEPDSSTTRLYEFWINNSFSLDLWFALNEDQWPVHSGGILLGAQSIPWEEHDSWANQHQQFIHIDNQGNLYCSVLDQKAIVARHLAPQRWYHLALTYDQPPGAPTQNVYLNGTLIHTAVGFLHHEAGYLRHAQWGTGCISGGSQGQPTDDYCGWYGFHGVLDGCRLWRGVLTHEQVVGITQGQWISTDEGGTPQVEWSMDKCEGQLQGLATHVQCTRPLERVCMASNRFKRPLMGQQISTTSPPTPQRS